MKCALCSYFEFNQKETQTGFCHRNPPTVFMMMGQSKLGQPMQRFTSQFAPVSAHTYCGEFKPIDEAAK